MACIAARSLGLLFACVLLVGCKGDSGPQVVNVTGKVVENGAPVDVGAHREGYNCLQVEFFPVDDAGNPVAAPHYSSFTAADGGFSLGGEEGKGIPGGKYRVVVRRIDRTKTVKPDPSGNIDAWKGKYDEEKSPFIVEVADSQGPIVIDLAQAPAKQ